MKIALMGNTYRPRRNTDLVTGYSIATNDLMRSFVRHSTAEELLFLYEPGQYQEVALQELQKEDRQGRVRLISEYDLLFHGPGSLQQINVLHSVKEDAVPLVALRERLGKPIPITFTMHGLAEQHLMLDTYYPLLYMPFKPYDAIVCTSDAVVRSLEHMLERLQRVNPPLVQVLGQPQIRLEKVPLGVDTDYFRPMDKRTVRLHYGVPEDAFTILWFGRFSPLYKADLYPLLHVFAQLRRNNPDRCLRLILVGSQDTELDYVGMLKKMIGALGLDDVVTLILNENIRDRAELYSIADVFTSPIDNIQETFGLTPVEAMACGIPQVVSDWDGYRDTVVHGETGFLVPTAWHNCMGDVASADYLPFHPAHRRLLQKQLAVRSSVVDCQAYLQYFQQLLDHPELCRSMACASRKRAVNSYDLRQVVSATENMWDRLLRIAGDSDEPFMPKRIPVLDPCADFRDYPTTMLTDDTVFSVNRFTGQQIAQESAVPAVFQHYVEEAALTEPLLDYLHMHEQATMAEIIAAFPHFRPDQLRRSVMHLYKYDFIRPL